LRLEEIGSVLMLVPPSTKDKVENMVVPLKHNNEYINEFHIPSFQNLVFHINLCSSVFGTLVLEFWKEGFFF
jgi:hypothetical protein